MTAFFVKSLQIVTRFIKKRRGRRNLSTKLHFLLMPDSLIPVQTPLSRWPQPASPPAGVPATPTALSPKCRRYGLGVQTLSSCQCSGAVSRKLTPTTLVQRSRGLAATSTQLCLKTRAVPLLEPLTKGSKVARASRPMLHSTSAPLQSSGGPGRLQK